MTPLNENGFLQYPGNYRQLLFYKKAIILYDMTYWYQANNLYRGDRTKDQMEQAARSGKQNVVEGKADGMTSKEMEIKLLNVARGSLQELRADYQDYLNTHHLATWNAQSDRLKRLRKFCHSNNDYDAYEPLLEKMNDEEMANLLLARINGYLNVYDPHPVGSRKRVKSYYDRFDPVALHAIRLALCNVATDKKEIHYCTG